MWIAVAVLTGGMVACGPSAAELKAENDAAQLRRDCGRTFSSSEKGLKDMLYKRRVAEVKFVERSKYIDKCVDLALGKAELKCVDPNLAEGSECKALPKDQMERVKKLQAYMVSPMTGKGGDTKTAEKPADKPAEGEAGGAAAGGEAPATAPE